MHKTQYQQCHPMPASMGTAPFAPFSHTTEQATVKITAPDTAPAPARRIRRQQHHQSLPAITGSTERQIQASMVPVMAPFMASGRCQKQTPASPRQNKTECSAPTTDFLSPKCQPEYRLRQHCHQPQAITAACRICRPARLQPAISAKRGRRTARSG